MLEERTGGGWTTLSTRLDEAGELVDGCSGSACDAVLPGGAAAAGRVRRVPARRRRAAPRRCWRACSTPAASPTVEHWLVARRQEPARALDEVDQRLGAGAGPGRRGGRAPTRRRRTCDRPTPRAGLAAAARPARPRARRADPAAAAAGPRTTASRRAARRATPVGRGARPADPAAARLAELDRSGRRARGRRPRWSRRRAASRRCVPLVAEVARLQAELATARAAALAAGTELAEALRPPAPTARAVATGLGRVGGRGRPAPTDAVRGRAAGAADEAGRARAIGAAERRPTGWPRPPTPSSAEAVELDAQARAARGAPRRAARRRAALEAAGDRSQAAARGRCPAPSRPATSRRPQRRGRAAGDRLDASAAPVADVVRARTDARAGGPADLAGPPAGPARGHGRRAGRRAGRRRRLPGLRQHRAPGARRGRPGLGRSRRRDRRGRGPGRRRRTCGWPPPTELAALDTRRAAAAARRPAATRPPPRSGRLRTAQPRSQRRWPSRPPTAEPDAAALAAVRRGARGLGAASRSRLDQNAATLKAQALADRDRLRELRATLDDARGTDPSIAARVARLAAAGRRPRRPGPAGRDGGPARGAGGRRPGAGRARPLVTAASTRSRPSWRRRRDDEVLRRAGRGPAPATRPTSPR